MALNISSREELLEWLTPKPRTWGQVVATRSAARVLPLIFEPGLSSRKTVSPMIVMAAFRSLIVSYSAQTMGVEESQRANQAYLQASKLAFRADRDANAHSASTRSLASIAYTVGGYAGLVDSIAGASSGAVENAANSAGQDSLDIWNFVSVDCDLLDKGIPKRSIFGKSLWNTAGPPEWYERAWLRATRWLSAEGAGFEIWREWYYGRLQGLPHAFADFDDAADEYYYRWILEQDDEWWSREPAEVNRDISEFVEKLRHADVPTYEELQQNPRAFTFSLDAQGRSTLDEDLLPNGLQGDADEHDNHREILRLIEAALIATAGDTNAKAIAEPTELLKEAVGQTVEDLRPRLFVLRARDVIRWVEESKGEDTRIPGLSKAQNDAFTPLIAALEMIAEFSPKLAELWHGKLGQSGPPLSREMLDLIAVALRASGQTTALAQSVIEVSNRQVAPDAPEDDPARIAASESSRNVVRKMGGTLKKAGEGAKSVEDIISLGERVAKIWGSLRGKLPDGEVIARILSFFGD